MHNNRTGETFDTIQEAIDDNDTRDGDIIFVESGTYKEHVRITKSIHLIGQDMKTTIIDGSGEGTVVRIEKDNVHIEGFQIVNGGTNFYDAGVWVYHSKDINLTDLVINTSHHGIFLENSPDTVINEVKLINNGGIFIYGEKMEHFLHTIKNVTLSGKPVIYIRNKNNVTVPINSTNVILVNCKNITVNGIDIENISLGIEIINSSNVVIKRSCISNNDFGIDILNSYKCTFQGCEINKNTYTGIYIGGCKNVNVNSSAIENNLYYGLMIHNSTNCVIHQNLIGNNDKGGLYILNSTKLRVTQNTFINNSPMIKGKNLEHFLHTFTGNTINGKKISYYKNTYGPYPNPAETGMVIFVNCTKGILEEFQSVGGANIAFEEAFCRNTRILNSTFSNNTCGIYSYRSSKETIENCMFMHSEKAIYLKDCQNSLIKNNYLSYNNEGMRLENTTGSKIVKNTFNHCGEVDIFLENSAINTISKNYLKYSVSGIKLQYNSDNCQIVDNCLNGTGWQSWWNLTGGYGGDGLYLMKSNNCTILNNSITHFYGEGIWLESCKNNSLVGNSVSLNRGNGIQLVNSSSNIITENYIYCNRWGIRLDTNSNGNKMWRNIFWFNGNRLADFFPPGGGNACDDGNNTWDGGYTDWSGRIIGGNYWSDRAFCIDIYSGPNQDQNGSDNICDCPRPIQSCSNLPTNNVDRYPLRCPDVIRPNCQILRPKRGYLYVGDREIFELPYDITVVVGDVNITVYARDVVVTKPKPAYSAQVSIYIWTESILTGTRRLEGEFDHVDYDGYTVRLGRWKNPHFGPYWLIVKAIDANKNECTDSMKLLIFNV